MHRAAVLLPVRKAVLVDVDIVEQRAIELLGEHVRIFAIAAAAVDDDRERLLRGIGSLVEVLRWIFGGRGGCWVLGAGCWWGCRLPVDGCRCGWRSLRRRGNRQLGTGNRWLRRGRRHGRDRRRRRNRFFASRHFLRVRIKADQFHLPVARGEGVRDERQDNRGGDQG